MFRKLLTTFLFIFISCNFYFAQTTVYAYIKDAEGKAIERAEVELKTNNKKVTADKIGYFQFVDLTAGHYQIVVSKADLEDQVIEFDIKTERRKDLGVITLSPTFTTADQGITILENSGDEENSSQTSTVGLLTASQDVFSRIAAYDLGAYWFRPRGIDNRTGEFMLNGVTMTRPDNGNVDFGNWGGLNEITRYPEIATNHSPSEYAFGAASSVIYKNTKPSENKKGLQATYSLTNRNYRNRASLRYSSGMNKNGWAYTIMGARRWAKEGLQEGTFYDAFGTYLGVEKKINDKHTLVFNFFGSPYRRSTASPSTQEVYYYRGVHYNSYWGFQDGEKRSERIKTSFEPLFQLSHYWQINKKNSLWTNLSYQFGKEKSSRLDWQNVQNPSSQYYRNLPSYYQDQIDQALLSDPAANVDNLRDAYNTSLSAWQNGDPNVTQINWGKLYTQNLSQPVTNLYGTSGKRSLYFLVNDVNDDKIFNATTHFVHNFNDTTKFLLNISYQNYRSELYREVSDLLGGDFTLNKDPFAATNNPGTSGFYNHGEVDYTKRKDDKINYNFNFSRDDVKLNPAVNFSTGKFDIFISGLVGYSTSNREGLFNHYLYADSFGKSNNYDFWNYGIKGKAIYKFNGRNFLVYNGAYLTQAPYLEDIFINPRVNSSVAPNLKSTIINANDLSYVLSSPFIKLRLTGYLIDTQNETNVQRFFADGIQLNSQNTDGDFTQVQSAFVTQVMSNVDKRNLGAEIGLDLKITPTLSIQGAASFGQFTYRNDPETYFASDAAGTFPDGKSYIDLGKAYLKNYKQGGTPQQGYSLGFRYNSAKYYWIGANWSYLGENYLDPSAIIRTERFVQNPVSGTPYAGISEADLRNRLQPTQLPNANFINANAGKSWRLGKYYVLLTASVNNIFNNTKYVTGGFEQTRNVSFPKFVQDNDRNYPLFGPKLFYTQSRSYFINMQFRF
ncbi:carboxypeptidase-like regulatory domain-containing protein [Halpernia frigidisoli]|uniref:Carboxypeptidase regulatory-like domain-containing protein n=1 Tax=Halpernia frigidisoli TaxID=1125876 RepID=A0A1I3HK67_9FLAO|nr:carboxypeptidase-like regulatory domain-containing protein [Halpernia frigidisoli]SFI36126.1 Carboxypeptidase regulatory-like domain-containing protein [Halpernia frigidisoli]